MSEDYTEEQLFNRFKSRYAQDIGTYLHELAETLIRENVKLRKTDKNIVLVHLLQNGIPRAAIDLDRLYSNFMNYVNDAIGFRLTPEQPLYYSDNCFGTADGISFRNNFLRVHDYKSGKTPAKMEQLLCYAALFCLEYKVKPTDLDGCELRIYQNDEVIFDNPTPDEIMHVMNIIVDSDKYVSDVIIGG
jgi:hypothetical protein